MKVLKMHDNADGKFDRFVKEQLDKTDVDTALADKYFAQMQLPVAGQAPSNKRKLRWFFICFGIGCLVATTAYLFTATDTKAPTVPTHSVAEPATLDNKPVANASDGNNNVAMPTSTNARDVAVAKTKDSANGINKILTNDQAAANQSALSVTAVQQNNAPMRPLEQPQAIKDTIHMLKTPKDSAVKALRTAVLPPKAKDSVYIVW